MYPISYGCVREVFGKRDPKAKCRKVSPMMMMMMMIMMMMMPMMTFEAHDV